MAAGGDYSDQDRLLKSNSSDTVVHLEEGEEGDHHHHLLQPQQLEQESLGAGGIGGVGNAAGIKDLIFKLRHLDLGCSSGYRRSPRRQDAIDRDTDTDRVWDATANEDDPPSSYHNRRRRRCRHHPLHYHHDHHNYNDDLQGGGEVLGDSAPPEWALLLVGCLLGLATGLCVAAFNRGVSTCSLLVFLSVVRV